MIFLFCTLKASANISRICPPSSRVSPVCHSAEPYGQGNTRHAHVSRRRLIMPLVALVQKITAHPQLRTFIWCLALASVVATAPPNSVFEQVSACFCKMRPAVSCGCKSGEFVQLREAVNKVAWHLVSNRRPSLQAINQTTKTKKIKKAGTCLQIRRE